MKIETKYNIGDKIKYRRNGIVYDGVIKGVYVEKRMRPKGAEIDFESYDVYIPHLDIGLVLRSEDIL